MLCVGVLFEVCIILIVFFATSKEKKRDVRREMFAKSMKHFNLHTPVTNVQVQIWHRRRRRKRATWTHKNDMWLFYRPYEKKNRYSTFLKENPKFVYRRLLWIKLSATTKSLNKDCLKQSFEIICLTFTTRFKFDNYFSIFLDLL